MEGKRPRTLTLLESGARAYLLLVLNTVAGLAVYYGIVTRRGGSDYAELALLTYVSSLGVLLAYSFQAGMIEDCAIRLGNGEVRRAQRMLARYELAGAGVGVAVMLACALAAGVSGRMAGWDWGVFAALVLSNVVSATNAPRHALLFAQGRAGEAAALQCLHAGTRLAMIGGGFFWLGPGAGVVAAAGVIGNGVAMAGYRRRVPLPELRWRRVPLRWMATLGRGWREVATARRVSSVLVRNGDQFQGLVEQLLFEAVGHSMRVAYTLTLPILSLLKQVTYAAVGILESEYAAKLGKPDAGEESRRAALVMRFLFWAGAGGGALALQVLVSRNWLPSRLGEALGPLRTELWVVPLALVLFPLLIVQSWRLLYTRRAHVYVGTYLLAAATVAVGLRAAVAAGAVIRVSLGAVVLSLVVLQGVQLALLSMAKRARMA